jgi:hypothetical protein
MVVDEAAAVLGVSSQASFLEIEDAYRRKTWELQSGSERTSLAEWEVQTEATWSVRSRARSRTWAPSPPW